MWHLVGATLAALWMTAACWAAATLWRTHRRAPGRCDCGGYDLAGADAWRTGGWVHERRVCQPIREWVA